MDGGYLEWKGFKPYIDPRADVFIKATNNKFDLLDEAFSLNTNANIKRFIRKYNFDYYIVDPEQDKYLYNYLKDEMMVKMIELYLKGLINEEKKNYYRGRRTCGINFCI